MAILRGAGRESGFRLSSHEFVEIDLRELRQKRQRNCANFRLNVLRDHPLVARDGGFGANPGPKDVRKVFQEGT